MTREELLKMVERVDRVSRERGLECEVSKEGLLFVETGLSADDLRSLADALEGKGVFSAFLP